MAPMADPVKKRPYSSPARAAKAAETRARILAAASEKFLADGYARTSTASIARAAGTSEATVFAVFGSKAELLWEVVIHDIRNTPNFPMGDLGLWQGLVGADRRDAAVQRMAAGVRGVMDRSWRSRAVVAAAATVDDAVREIVRRGAQGRHGGALWVVREVLEIPEAEAGRVADAFWTLMSVDNYTALVLDRGWSSDEYEAWLAAMMRACLPR
jgi:TetR/AcrR family transcriptional regulator of autoinduction and epiphytic fitness